MLFFLSRHGFLVLGVVSGGVFVLACLLGSLRLRIDPYAFVGLVLAGPVASIIAYAVINPDPGCTYDCPAKAGYSFFLAVVTCTWWLGLAVGAFVASRLSGRPSKRAASR